MHATIHRFRPNAGVADDLAQPGRKLAAALSELPGFVSFVMLESRADGLAAIAIFDDAAGLPAGDAAIARWFREYVPEAGAGPATPLLSGEIIVQRGM